MKFLMMTIAAFAVAIAPSAAQSGFTLEGALSYTYVTELATAADGNAIAFVEVVKGTRNIWVANGPGFVPHSVMRYMGDDGQELSQLTFSPDGKHLVYVRGGDHDADWPVMVQPNPSSAPDEPKTTIWAASLKGGTPVKIAEGDNPALSSKGMLAFIKDKHVWTASLSGRGEPHQLFFDRGTPDNLAWSPDGTKLAFISKRDDDHAFLGIYDVKGRTISYLAPSTGRDSSPRWSPDGTRIAFVRLPGEGGAPEPILKQIPHPFALWVGDVTTLAAKRVWQSPGTLLGSYPETAGEVNLHWATGDRLVFLADLDNWPHLYAIPSTGGEPLLLTPGNYMVEHVTISRDRNFMIYSANTGTRNDDDDRRHVFRVPVDAATPVALTSGDTLEWNPVAAGTNTVAFIAAGAKAPVHIGIMGLDGTGGHALSATPLPREFPQDQFIVPQSVSFVAADGWTIHGQLFDAHPEHKAPAIIFVHGGPPRQMLLGWHYMGYYANAYAVNQYLAARGYKVLSVNYRLGIGYGHAFHHPDYAGYAGAAEYQDVVAGARFLQGRTDVDGGQIGIWGGSYGGYLTAMALARNSDLFKAGVDLHGVHDWSLDMQDFFKRPHRFETGDYDEALKVAFESSPVASVATWKSPVLLIHGDDDHNVRFQQTIDLVQRLTSQHVPYEEMAIPNDIHFFLRWQNWLAVDKATAAFFAKELPVK